MLVLFRGRMILLILFYAVVAAEINLAPFELDRLRLINRLARHGANGVDLDCLSLFLRHLRDESVGVLVELVHATLTAEVNVLALILRAIFFDDRAAADRAELVGDGFLRSAVEGNTRSHSARKHR